MDGKVVIGTELDTKSFDKQIEKLETELQDLQKQKLYFETHGMTGELLDVEVEIEKTENKLVSLKKQQAKVNEQGFSQANIDLSSISKGLTSVVGKVGKWALAVFSLRGAYMLVRQATSTLAETNDDIKGKLEGIRLFIASALEPIITRIINLVYTLLSYVNFLAKAWFGVDIFANASAKAMKSGAKSVKDMKKSLAGFDEMNVISDTSASGSGGAGGSAGIPTPEDVPIPSWIQWIADNKDTVLAFITGLVAGLIALKVFGDGIMSLGIGLAVAGVVKLVGDLIDFFNEPTWDKFADILIDISLILARYSINNWRANRNNNGNHSRNSGISCNNYKKLGQNKRSVRKSRLMD